MRLSTALRNAARRTETPLGQAASATSVFSGGRVRSRAAGSGEAVRRASYWLVDGVDATGCFVWWILVPAADDA
jgi:hypothetical protein